MGYTQWLLVQQSDLTFRFVTNSCYGEFHDGRGTLPQVHPAEVRTVEVVLHLERRAVGEVIHVDHRRFPVLASGRRDPASMESQMDLISDIVGLDSSTRPDSARRRWATRQIECTYRWTPTSTFDVSYVAANNRVVVGSKDVKKLTELFSLATAGAARP